jgi:glycosyltransferase involved in cell wall biosynthesis
MLKRRIARFAVGVAISRFMAVHYRDGSIVIPNPIDVTRLIPDENCHRDKDIVFVGRLIADKGVHVLLEAISLLAAEGHVPVVSIIGDGPERSRLVKLRDQLGLSEIVEFSGALSGSGLTESICRHKVMAIPSVWTEPFGIVALEGLACGCALVASDTGGLPDAVGSCGLLVPPNDAKALAKGLRAALDAGNLSKLEIEARRRHLAKHSPDRIAERYVRLFLSQTRDWNCGAGNLD